MFAIRFEWQPLKRLKIGTIHLSLLHLKVQRIPVIYNYWQIIWCKCWLLAILSWLLLLLPRLEYDICSTVYGNRVTIWPSSRFLWYNFITDPIHSLSKQQHNLCNYCTRQSSTTLHSYSKYVHRYYDGRWTNDYILVTYHTQRHQ